MSIFGVTLHATAKTESISLTSYRKAKRAYIDREKLLIPGFLQGYVLLGYI